MGSRRVGLSDEVLLFPEMFYSLIKPCLNVG